MRKTFCAICENNKNTKVLFESTLGNKKLNSNIFSARRTPDRLHYRLVKCQNCGLIFSNPILDLNKINSLYLKSDFNYSGESEYLKKTYFKYFQKYLSIKNLKDKKILEIGCGNGFFLQELMDKGIKNVYGIEPGIESVNKAPLKIRNNIKVDILKEGLFAKENFDIILCFHTLDHIPYPNRFLEIVYSLLKKGGQIFFVVHNTNGLSVKLLKEKSPIFDIEHIYLFNRSNLAKIFTKNRFNNTNVFDISNTYPLSYWIKLFPIPILSKTIILKLLKLTKIGLIPVKLNAGNIGIVAVK